MYAMDRGNCDTAQRDGTSQKILVWSEIAEIKAFCGWTFNLAGILLRMRPESGFLLTFLFGGPGGLLGSAHLRKTSDLVSRLSHFKGCPPLPRLPALGRP